MKLIIAIAVEKDSTLHQGHFGDSPFFDVYEIDGSTITFIERRENPLLTDEEPRHGKVKGIAAFLNDCDIFAGRSFGLHSLKKLYQLGKRAWLVKHLNVQELLKDVSQKDSRKIMQFNPETGKFESMP